MLVVVTLATGAFIATNIDDLVVLTALFGSPRPTPPQIVTGQYLGMSALVAISVVAAAGLTVVPERWIGLLGIVPLGLGLRGLLGCHEEAPRPLVASTLGVAAITIANGADNVSVYAPLFHGAGRATFGYVAIFAVLVVVWLAVARFLATRRPVVRLLDRWGHWLIPCVFIAIGATLLVGAIQ